MKLLSITGMVLCCSQIGMFMASILLTLAKRQSAKRMRNTLTHSLAGVQNQIWWRVINITMRNMMQL